VERINANNQIEPKQAYHDQNKGVKMNMAIIDARRVIVSAATRIKQVWDYTMQRMVVHSRGKITTLRKLCRFVL
jgi:hypothetical protein